MFARVSKARCIINHVESSVRSVARLTRKMYKVSQARRRKERIVPIPLIWGITVALL
jgi:hypothetical protein